MDFDAALAAHQDWKIKLRTAVAQKTRVDAATISRDDCCALGKWLHGDAKSKHAAAPPYRACVEAHATFHREAGKVAALINGGKYDEAEKALGNAAPYAAASMKVGTAIIQMRRLASKAA